MGTVAHIRTYLEAQAIVVQPAIVRPSFFDPSREIAGEAPAWSTLATQTHNNVDLAHTQAESMSLASMQAVHILGAHAGENVLDMCAAPGMKSLYLHALEPNVQLYGNDLSADRISRMRRLFEKHGVSAEITKCDARFLGDIYDEAFFDKILIDAPCSGEGLAMVGNQKQAEAWSPAKVKRLQQLQIKILKTGWHLLRPGGTLVYATCTLNKNENERVIHKALKIDVSVVEAPLTLHTLPHLQHAQALRVLPSENSIGFFVALLQKHPEE